MVMATPRLARAALVVGTAVAIGLAIHTMRRDPPPAEPQVSEAGSEPAEPTPHPAAPDSQTPSFDLVRVAPDGSAVVAGRAAPGSSVTIRTETGTLAEVEADAAGEFVAVFRAEPSAAPQTLILDSKGPDGARAASPDVVVLLPASPQVDAPSDAPGPTGAAPLPEPASSSPEGGTAIAEAPAQPPSEDTSTLHEPEVAATVILRDGAVEATPTLLEGATGGLALASISYGETGLVTLAGFGSAGAQLRAYVDDRFARNGAVAADGRWSLELGDVAAGVYRLRIDAIRADGTVEARVETPFQRDIPEKRPAAPTVGDVPGTVTVQPGSNLWTLARLHYGAGVLYTKIFTANRDLIRDPELIYPGQIFVLPEVSPVE